MARTKRASIHYVNNAQFSQAVVDYVTSCNEAKAAGKEQPIVPNYIADCFYGFVRDYLISTTSFGTPTVKRWLWTRLRTA